MIRFFTLCFLFISIHSIKGQDPYQIDMEQELDFLQASVFFIGSSKIMEYQQSTITEQEILRLEKNTINSLDRFAVQLYSKKAAIRSDIGMLAPMGIGAASLLIYPKGKDDSNYYSHLIKLLILYAESNAINYGGKEFIKHLVKRTRPLAYNDEVALEEKLQNSSKKSFFSGHTSFSAGNSFFAAKVFSDYYPESKWKPLVWALAIAVPAWTGVERIAAGKHFPSDVLVGYAYGALCGYLIPHMHLKSKERDMEWSLTPVYHPSYTGISFTYIIK